MKNNIYLKDYLVSRVISFNKEVDGYDKIFYKTNEDLIDIYLDIDFYDKDVLSVLGSGDQVLTARYLDAKKVDTFDFNRLTLYYFYLRLWTIKYNHKIYPNVLCESNRWLKELLEEVSPSSDFEKMAYNFFSKHIKDNTKISNLFFERGVYDKGKTIYIDSKELEDYLSTEINFYEIDLFSEFNISNTYDIVIISNILEWARKDRSKICNVFKNLNNIVRENGIIICSELIDRSDSVKEMEKDIFSKGFEFLEKGKSYCYIKK